MIDALVVGAGPAGNQVAHTLSRLGHSVLVLESRDRIGDKLCTGIVSQECVLRYRVPASLIYRAVRAAWLVPPNGKALLVQRNEVQAHVIDRVGFVDSIAARARTAGAEYRLGYKVTDVTVLPECVLVTARNGNRVQTYRARTLIVASGFASSIGRKAGLKPPRTLAFATQATLTGVDVDEIRVYARRWVPSGFFGWVVPTAPGMALAGLLGRSKPGAALREMLAGIVEDGIRPDAVGKQRVWGVPVKPSARSFADRCLLVGDAAGQANPTTGGGIFYALRCGDVAAEVLSDCLRRDDLSRNALAEYECRWKGELGREMRLGYMARLVYERLGDRELDRMLSVAASSGFLNGDISFDWHGELVVRALKSRLFGAMLSIGSTTGATAGGDS